MPQTVATVRGTTTANHNGQTTLFTQSGGNSTRVILNQVTWYYNSQYSNINANLLHISSSGPVTIIGFFSITTGAGVSSGQLMPNPNGTSPTQSTGVSTTNASANAIVAFSASGGGNTWLGSLNPSALVFGPNYGYSYMPQNHWIGPGDSIVFVQSNGNSASSQVGYHFTTITES
jgi:hypothetical protein